MDDDFEIDQKNLSKENQESFEKSFSNNDCFINSNPIYNYMKEEDSKISETKSISTKNEVKTNKTNEEKKSNKFYNLYDPKLIDAYNEGYYGFNNVPKQFYIYPKFSKKFYNKNQEEIEEPKNEDRINDIVNKDTYLNIMIDDKSKNISKSKNNINDNEFIYSYTNYPYPKLINISSNLFGLSHQFKSNYQNLDKNSINEKEIEQNIENNDNENDKDDGDFYFINNNITARNVPFENIPDDSSIDDEEQEINEEE